MLSTRLLSRPVSRVVVRPGSSADSGFSRRTWWRRTSSAGRPRRSKSAGPANGNVLTSTRPSPARTVPERRRSFCAIGQATAGRSCRQDRRDLVVADDAQHLFDEVVGVVEVEPPARRRRDQRLVIEGHLAAVALERLHHSGGVDVDTGHPRRQVDVHRDRRARRRGAHDRGPFGSIGRRRARPAARDALGCAGRELGVDAALDSAWRPRTAACAAAPCARSSAPSSAPPR